MIVYIIILGLIFLSHLTLHKMVVRMITYQNFKNNVILRLTLHELFKEFNIYEKANDAADDPDEIRAISDRQKIVLDRIKSKINIVIDEELNNSESKDILVAINSEIQSFKIDNSYPFYQVFNRDILKRFYEKRKQ